MRDRASESGKKSPRWSGYPTYSVNARIAPRNRRNQNSLVLRSAISMRVFKQMEKYRVSWVLSTESIGKSPEP